MADGAPITRSLDPLHLALGARMVPFGGWDMPVGFPGGALAEHAACRGTSALFDVRYLGSSEFGGSEALGVLQTAFSNELRRIAPGRAQYAHLLDDAYGSVVDDIIVWWLYSSSGAGPDLPAVSPAGRAGPAGSGRTWAGR